MPVPTPHIEAKAGQIAKTVLMPGDPLRSKFIAETFLENPVLVNNVRGVQGYTGTWKGCLLYTSSALHFVRIRPLRLSESAGVPTETRHTRL